MVLARLNNLVVVDKLIVWSQNLWRHKCITDYWLVLVGQSLLVDHGDLLPEVFLRLPAQVLVLRGRQLVLSALVHGFRLHVVQRLLSLVRAGEFARRLVVFESSVQVL